MNDQNSLYSHLRADCVSEALRSFPKKEAFEGLSRYKKGFWFEMYIHHALDMNDANYTGNAPDFSDWCANQIKGYDLKIIYPNGEEEKIELKLVLGDHLYPCWIEEDWLNRDADIIVTNNVSAVPYKSRRMLEKARKKLMSVTEFIMYCQRKMRGLNQHSWNNIFTLFCKALIGVKHRLSSSAKWLNSIRNSDYTVLEPQSVRKPCLMIQLFSQSMKRR